MSVAVGSTNIDAQTTLISLKGTLAEIRAELAAGTAAEAAYTSHRCKSLNDVVGFAGSGTTWAVIYTVEKP